MIFAWSVQRLGYAVGAARNSGWDVFVFAIVSRRGCGLLDVTTVWIKTRRQSKAFNLLLNIAVGE